MTTVYGIRSTQAVISACAIDATTRRMLNKGLHWQLSTEEGQLLEMSEASQVRFTLRPGVYQLRVQYQNQESHINDIRIKVGEETALVLLVPDNAQPDFYHIDDETVFNTATEYQRRQMEREGQAKYGQNANALSEPVARSEAQAQRNALYGRRMGPKSHPLLRKPQFDGIDDKVNPTPDRNTEVAEELQKQLDLALSNDLSAKYKPPGTP